MELISRLFGRKGGGAQVRKSARQTPLMPSDAARVAEGLPIEDEESPWAKAQRVHDDRYLRLAILAGNRLRQNWALMGMLLLGGFAYYQLSTESKYIPVLVEVDKLGRTIAVKALTGADAITDSRRIVYQEVWELMPNLRTITADAGMNNDLQKRGFSRLRGAAYEYAREDAIANPHNKIAETKTVEVKVELALPVSDTSYQVEWWEQAYNIKGEKIGQPERWKANIVYTFDPSDKPEEIRKNSSGFYVTGLSWTRQ